MGRVLAWGDGCSKMFPEPMLSINLEDFIIKNEILTNSINIQFRRKQTFTDDNGF